jgi:hypothetical protein
MSRLLKIVEPDVLFMGKKITSNAWSSKGYLPSLTEYKVGNMPYHKGKRRTRNEQQKYEAE